MEQPTIELDDERQAIGDVSGRSAGLPDTGVPAATARELVGTFHWVR